MHLPRVFSSSPVFRFVDGASRTTHSSSALLHQDRSGGQHSGLIKQAYSAWVLLSEHSKPRKWHLTAYFTYADLPSIPTVDQDPLLCKIVIPMGIYRGGKARASRGEDPEYSPRQDSPSLLSGDSETTMYRDENMRVLPPLLSRVGSHYGVVLHPKSPIDSSSRMSEDQRVIRMLNSRYVS